MIPSTMRLVIVSVVIFIVIIGGLWITNAVFIAPSGDMDLRMSKLRGEIDDLQNEKRRAAIAMHKLREIRQASYSDEVLQAREAARQRLLHCLQRSGLTKNDYSVDGWSGRQVSKTYREVGWSIQASGTLKQVTDFLYLLREDPYVSRVDNLSISPQWQDGLVNLKLRYASLVIDASETNSIEPNQVKPEALQVALTGDGRGVFNVIEKRDLMRPYIKKRPPVVVKRPTEPEKQPNHEKNPDPPKGPSFAERMKLVGLPQWQGQTEAIFKDTQSGQTTQFKVGEDIAGGTFVMVDYRVLRRHDDAERITSSRLIMKVGPDYWAVELGDTLAQRHQLDDASLPAALRVDDTASAENDGGSLSRTNDSDGKTP